MKTTQEQRNKRKIFHWMSKVEKEDALIIRHEAAIFVKMHFGPRCVEYCWDCECCRRWAALDKLFGDIPT